MTGPVSYVIVTGKVTRTSSLDVYATFEANEGAGGYMSVANAAKRLALTGDQLRAYMIVIEIDTGDKYELQPDLTTWIAIPTTADTMLKSVYDPNDDGKVVSADYADAAGDADTLGGTSITSLNLALANKLEITEVGVSVASLVSGTVPIGQLPFGTTLCQGIYDGALNVPALVNGVGTAGHFYIVTVPGAAGVMGAVIAGDTVVYDGANWVIGAPFTTGVVSWNGLMGAVTADLDDVADTATRFALTVDENAALAGTSGTPPSGANKLVDAADTRLTDSRAPNGLAGGDLTGSYPIPTIAAGVVSTAKIADDAVTTAKILDLNVTTAKIANSAITGSKLAGSSVSDSKISSVSWAKVTGAPTFIQSGGAAGGDLGGTYPNPTVTDLTISGETTGDLLYFNGSNWIRLAAGVAGKVLKSNGAGVAPSWETDLTAGAVVGLAFVRNTYNVSSAIGNTDTIAAATATSITLTLPSAAAYTGGFLIIKDEAGLANTGTGVQVDCDGADTFEDASTSFTMTSQNGFIKLYSNGVNKWFILESNL